MPSDAPKDSDERLRPKPRLRAFILGITGFVILLVVSFTWQDFISFNATIASINSTAPANQTASALLPQGPQKMTLTYTVPASSSNPAETVTESGYIDFSGIDPTTCSMDITGTASAAASAATPKSQVSFTDTKAANQVAFDALTTATGAYKSDPLNVAVPFDYPTHTAIVVPIPALTTRFNEGLCSFDQLARYASIAKSGLITWKPAKLKAVDTYYIESFYKPIVAASNTNAREKNTVYNGLLSASLPTNIKVTLDVYHATLLKQGSSIVYTQTSPSKVTITFMPTSLTAVPKSNLPSFQKEAIAYAKAGASVGALPTSYKP